MRNAEVRLGSTFLVLVTLTSIFLVVVPNRAAAAQDGDYTYTISGNPSVATITRYSGDGGAIAIPATLGGYPTAVIGDAAFFEGLYSDTRLTSVIIPDSVRTIGDDSFGWCPNLAFVAIGSNVTTIGSAAFYQCTSLTSMTIPNSVTTIGSAAFFECTSLASVTIGGGVTSIGAMAFASCVSLTSLTFFGLVQPTADHYWVIGTNAEIMGHAYAASDFPAPGSVFYGLTMGAVIPLPGPPANLTVTPGDAQVLLSWNAPDDNGSGVVCYRVYRSTAESGNYSLVATVPGTSYTDVGLVNGQTYWYKVGTVARTNQTIQGPAVPVALESHDPSGYLAPLIGGVALVLLVALLFVLYGRRGKN